MCHSWVEDGAAPVPHVSPSVVSLRTDMQNELHCPPWTYGTTWWEEDRLTKAFVSLHYLHGSTVVSLSCINIHFSPTRLQWMIHMNWLVRIFNLSQCVCTCLLLCLTQENGRRQKTLVCEKFDQLYSVLEEKKREMSQKVTAEQEEKVNYIRGLTRKYGDHLEESCKTVELGIQTMEEAEMALFLQVRVKWGSKCCHKLNIKRLQSFMFYV